MGPRLVSLVVSSFYKRAPDPSVRSPGSVGATWPLGLVGLLSCWTETRFKDASKRAHRFGMRYAVFIIFETALSLLLLLATLTRRCSVGLHLLQSLHNSSRPDSLSTGHFVPLTCASGTTRSPTLVFASRLTCLIRWTCRLKEHEAFGTACAANTACHCRCSSLPQQTCGSLGF